MSECTISVVIYHAGIWSLELPKAGQNATEFSTFLFGFSCRLENAPRVC